MLHLLARGFHYVQ